MGLWLNRSVGLMVAVALTATPTLSACLALCGPSTTPASSAVPAEAADHARHHGLESRTGTSPHHEAHDSDGVAGERTGHHPTPAPAQDGRAVEAGAPSIRAAHDCCSAGVRLAEPLPAGRADVFPAPLSLAGVIAAPVDSLVPAAGPTTHSPAASPPAPPGAIRILRI